MPGQQFEELQPYNQVMQFNSGSTPNTFTDSGIDNQNIGSVRLDQIRLSNTDTIDHTVGFSFIVGITGLIGYVAVPAGAGLGTVPTVDALAVLCDSLNHFLRVGGTYGGTLAVTVGEAITAGKDVYVALIGGQA